MLEFINEIATAATGTDCRATAGWLNLRMQDGTSAAEPGALALRRAAQFWELADESLQLALGAQCGFTEPTKERFPAPSGIAKDFEIGLAWAYEQIGEPSY